MDGYDGIVVKSYPTKAAALSCTYIQAYLAEHGSTKLLLRYVPGHVEGFRDTAAGTWQVLDGAYAAPPYASCANDVRSTGLQPNAMFTPGGYLRVIAEDGIPRFQTNRSLLENTSAEICVEYGQFYWDMFGKAGTSIDDPIILD